MVIIGFRRSLQEKMNCDDDLRSLSDLPCCKHFSLL